MPNFTLNNTNFEKDIDLGNGTLTMINDGPDTVQVYIEYEPRNIFVSAILMGHGHTDPIVLAKDQSTIVNRLDLEVEHVRVRVRSVNDGPFSVRCGY